jgi:predicted negative regulator of RcsB-dependent stress response
MKSRPQPLTQVEPDFAHQLELYVEQAGKYGWQILAGGVLLAALAIAGYFYWQTNHDRQAVAWSTYLAAMSARDREQALQQVVLQFGDTDVGNWAQLSLGDANVTAAANNPAKSVFANRDEALKVLDSAAASYNKVLSTARNPLMLSRARFGLARVHETRCQPEEAIKLYEQVAKENPTGEIGIAAAKAAKRLQDPNTQEFMKWFAAYKPVKPAPIPGMGPVPGVNNRPTPDTPDVSLPGGIDLNPPTTPSDTPDLKFPDLGDPGKSPDKAPAEKPADAPAEPAKP